MRSSSLPPSLMKRETEGRREGGGRRGAEEDGEAAGISFLCQTLGPRGRLAWPASRAGLARVTGSPGDGAPVSGVPGGHCVCPGAATSSPSCSAFTLHILPATPGGFNRRSRFRAPPAGRGSSSSARGPCPESSSASVPQVLPPRPRTLPSRPRPPQAPSRSPGSRPP